MVTSVRTVDRPDAPKGVRFVGFCARSGVITRYAFRYTMASRTPTSATSSVERLLEPFDGLPVAAYVVRVRDATILGVDSEAVSMVGLPASQIVGRPEHDILDFGVRRDDPGRPPPTLHATGTSTFEDVEIRLGAGRPLRVDATVKEVTVEGEACLVVAMVDRTALHRAEEDRRSASARYAMLARHGRDLVTLLDRRGTILWASPSSRDVLGQEPDRLEGRPVLTLVHPDDRRHAESALDDMLGASPTYRVTLRIRHADGIWKWLEVLGSRVTDESASEQGATLLLSSRDVTSRVASQEQAERLIASEAAARQQGDMQRALLDGVIENAPSAIAVYRGPDLVLERANGTFLDLTASHDLIGAPSPEADGDRHDFVTIARRVFQRGEPAEGRAEPLRLPGDGDADVQRYVDYRVEPIRHVDRGTMRISVHAVDVTDLVLAEQSARRSEEDATAIAAFGLEMMETTDTGELFRVGTERLVRMTGAEFGLLYERVGDEFRLRSMSGAVTDRLKSLSEVPQNTSVGLLARVMRSRRPVFTSDYAAEIDRDPTYGPQDVGGVLLVPIGDASTVSHVLVMGVSHTGWALDAARLDVAAAFGRRMEAALEARERVSQIVATREETFRVLGLALEHRDFETHGHTDRVVRLSRAFAERLDLDADSVQALVWGAYLHDLGKLSIEDPVLLKPSSLTESEFALVERHTVIGEEIASGIAFLPRETLQVVRNHHERWDGTGYPDGLAGEDIPYLARMFALADVYDALTSARPYKSAWTLERARATIAAAAGTQFDPALVEPFLEVVGAD